MTTCYRHSDRETGVSCSNCSRPICPDCMTPTSVGMRCPECARDRTPVRTIASLTPDPQLTYALIGINVVVALGNLLGGAGLGAGGSVLTQFGAVSRDTVAAGEWWRLITAGFLHAGAFHLLFNMFALYTLGPMIEPAIGRLRFGLIYFVSLLTGSFGALLLQPTGYTVGASGAIFGLMGAAFVIMRSRGIDPMQSGLGMWLGLNLAITFLLPGISVGGHLGGLAGGALAALLLVELGERRRMPRGLAAALVIVVGALSVTGAVAVSYV